MKGISTTWRFASTTSRPYVLLQLRTVTVIMAHTCTHISTLEGFSGPKLSQSVHREECTQCFDNQVSFDQSTSNASRPNFRIYRILRMVLILACPALMEVAMTRKDITHTIMQIRRATHSRLISKEGPNLHSQNECVEFVYSHGCSFL